LMKHDLVTSNEISFRKLKDNDSKKFSKTDIQTYLNNLNSGVEGSAITKFDESYAISKELEKAYGYDDMSLREKMEIKRVDKTDYLRLEFDSENPKLSYFVLKTFIDEFFNFYYSKQDNQINRAYMFYDTIVGQKKIILDSLTSGYNNYSKNNAIVALDEQSTSIVTQLKELEMARAEEEQKLFSNEAAKKNLEGYSTKYNRLKEDDFSKTVYSNKDIKDINDQISKLELKNLDSGFKDENIKKQIEELKKKRKELSTIIANSRRKVGDILDDKEKEFFVKYVDAETNYEMSKQSLSKINEALGQIRGQKGKLVKDNAFLHILGNQLEIARKEFEHYVDLRNAAELNKKSSENPLKVIEYPILPLKPESSKRALMSIFAAVATGTLTLLFLFFMSYFESTASNAAQLKKLTGYKPIGIVNTISPKQNYNLDDLFNQFTQNIEGDYFKESIRRVRTEIEHTDKKTFLFVSPKEQEGKSFIIALLAFTMRLKNSKVLIVDTNFKNNTLSSLSQSSQSAESLNTNGLAPFKSSELGFNIDLSRVDIIGNKGGHNSPSELLSGVDFKKKMEKLSANYDYIFFEAAAMNKYSDARELVDYVDKVIIIFDAKNKINNQDTEALSFVKKLGDKFLGAILNKVDLKNIS
jgi:polysaccharide biosynthesis transport protein